MQRVCSDFLFSDSFFSSGSYDVVKISWLQDCLVRDITGERPWFYCGCLNLFGGWVDCVVG